jgi:hypothetical protein
MSKTALDAATILYRHLAASVLFSDAAKPSGELWLYQRPQGSRTEDVVINSLGMSRDGIQQGVLNVNAYVPNLERTQPGGEKDRTLPNTRRLTELSNLLNQALRETWAPDGGYVFQVQQDQVFPDTNQQHFVNFRIEFRAVNFEN